ncbi:hypothetical protein PINS_up009557 [Pythium insidiosum]|nr:hypothetical protein PINS_up009557 [Pythium insidiosum]
MTGLHGDAEAREPVNYRQVGTRASGSVLRGAAVRRQPSPEPQSRVSSIPSKYETVLHRDSNERNAFGNRTQRFGESENDLPGPGAYYKPPSMVRTTQDSGSVSKLGYSTGFVSKTKRFSERIRDTAPGPGQYTYQRNEKKSLNRKHGSASFAAPGRTSSGNNDQFTTPSVAVPGPGEYNVSQTSSAIAHNIARAAFSSKVTRGFEPKRDVPPPGQYDNPIQLSQALQRGNRSPQSVFKSTAKRLEDPIEAKRAPGPGAYNAQEAEVALRYDWIARAHTSAVFHKGNTDRFGRPPTKQTSDTDVIGPGSYTLPSAFDDSSAGGQRSPVTSSVFRSTTSRAETFGGQRPSEAPGPAFYHPTSPDKRSHILNSNKKWL